MSETVLLAVICLIAGIALGAAIVALARPRTAEAERAAEQGISSLNSRLDGMASWLQSAHGQLQKSVNERLDAVSQNLGVSVQTAAQHTTENLQKLNERLAVIDTAQKNITELATQVSSLQGILANKQSRGAFGQGQLEAIVTDLLPRSAYEFQYTLRNKARPDCAIFMPPAGPLIIDAKFPLEAMTAFRDAAGGDERKQATARVKQDIARHISDISEKYLIPGETQDIALMFIPSESLYADLHEHFDDLVQRARRARVMIVSPNMAVLAIQLVRQIRKDAEMQEAVDTIRNEVTLMMKDVGLLGERVRKLQTHFGQANTDIEAILTSSGKIEKRATKIEGLDFDEEADSARILPGPGARKLEAGE